ncbi:HAMP domain-containing histidine kinase [Carboxylicivirga sp. A043]|uniref:sensor histidine kinase n=1 Tax=Carboxylicivirga litoralis TaxID=2816963 RepID=UPI0021CAFCF0|nr:HAMP domain-containing sensor histidine kinase [Carboxylicivirga sp. A043]MCU4157524.1 HAMP domain-containing histidine kinase [Carboxylicivirga sp. A043]
MFRGWVKNQLEAKEFKESDGLFYWRERIYRSIVFIISITGLPAYVFGIYLSIKHNLISITIADTIVYGLLLFLWLKNPFTLKIKTILLISFPLILGVLLIIIAGPRGAGFSYFLGFIILASILLGFKGTIAGLVIHIVFSTIIGVGLASNWFDTVTYLPYSTTTWITITINSLVICSITSIPLSVLMHGLNNYITRHNLLENSLKEKIKQLAKAKKEADKANELKTKFLANMSHEVRTPLNVISGFSEIVQKGMYRNTKERDQFLYTINQNGQYLLNIIENILDISMIESQQLKYHIKTVNLCSFMQDIQQVYKINHTPIDILFVPMQTNCDINFQTDETRLKQVLINLINNAIKYTEKGHVSIGFEMCDERLLFSVSDTGIGIHPDDMEHIFDRFVKIANPNTVIDGTGLGLAISRSIIEALGGTISVESILNKGSVFTVSLPLQTQKAPFLNETTN